MDEEDIKKVSEMIREEIQAAIDRAKSNDVSLQLDSGAKVEFSSSHTDLKILTELAHQSLNQLKIKSNGSIPPYCQ